MTIIEAVQIAEQERKSKVVGANDCGDKWFFCFEDDDGKTDAIPLFVFKNDGRCEYFCLSEFMYMLASGEVQCTPVELPR